MMQWLFDFTYKHSGAVTKIDFIKINMQSEHNLVTYVFVLELAFLKPIYRCIFHAFGRHYYTTEIPTILSLFSKVFKQQNDYAIIAIKNNIEPCHEISNNVVCATSKGSDQPAHMRRLIRAFASRLNIP